MFIRLLRIFRGSVYVVFSGENPERMLTLLSRSGLPFWNIKRRRGGITVCMYAAHIKRLRSIRRKTGIKVHITGRRGLPFRLRRYRHRSGLFLGVVLFFAINWVASLFIWNIQIEGNMAVPSDEILHFLRSEGIGEGTLKSTVDCDNVRVRLAMQTENISWASLSIEGCVLTVSVHERQPVIPPDSAPCNLVAVRDGVVGDIRVLAGKTVVKKGDTVQKGQLLVSGVLEYTTGNTDLVAAKGEVFAETTRDIVVKQPLSYIQTRRTGENAKRRVLTFFGLNIPLYLGTVDYPYERDTERSRFEANGAYLPISLTTATFHKTEERLIKLTRQQAEAAALKQMNDICRNVSEYEILSFTDSFELADGQVVLTRHIQARENIAQREILQIDSANGN